MTENTDTASVRPAVMENKTALGYTPPDEAGLKAEPKREVPQSFGKAGMMNVPGYEELAAILIGAYQQSAQGKGLERHGKGNSVPFKDQRIMALARDAGIGAHTYQISKKAMEAGDMVKRNEFQKAIHEFRGVIVYAAAAILLASELDQASGHTNQ